MVSDFKIKPFRMYFLLDHDTILSRKSVKFNLYELALAFPIVNGF